ncbi:MAG: hypothetical protein HY862_13875 [Chloroflexi bacterium]|nr:hypothetical protein [Chloroflexota bacterium]
MNTRSLKLQHFYFGNIRGPGQVVVGSSFHDISNWKERAETKLTLGNLSQYSELWRGAPSFEGMGVFQLSDGGAVVTTLQKANNLESDSRLPFLYHWVILSQEDVLALGGNWLLLTNQLRQADFIDQKAIINYLLIDRPLGSLEPLHIFLDNGEQSNYYEESLSWLYNKFDHEWNILERLLTSLFHSENKNGRSILVGGLPDDMYVRDVFAMSIAAILPPALRHFVTFSTKSVSTENHRIWLYFLDHLPDNLDRQWVDWKHRKLKIDGADSSPFVQMLIDKAQAGQKSLQDFHEKYQTHAERISRYHFLPRTATNYLYAWTRIEEGIPEDPYEKWQLFINLMLKDKSLSKQDRARWLGRVFPIAFSLINNQEQVVNSLDNLITQYPYLENALIPTLQSNLSQASAIMDWLETWLQVRKNLPQPANINWEVLARDWLQIYSQHVYAQRNAGLAYTLLEQLKITSLPISTRQWDELLQDHANMLPTLRQNNIVKEHAVLYFRLLMQWASVNTIFKSLSIPYSWYNSLPTPLQELFTQNINTPLIPTLRESGIESDVEFLKIARVLHKQNNYQSFPNYETLNFFMRYTSATHHGSDFLEIDDTVGTLTLGHCTTIAWEILFWLSKQHYIDEEIHYYLLTWNLLVADQSPEFIGPIIQKIWNRYSSDFETVFRRIKLFAAEPSQTEKLALQLWKYIIYQLRSEYEIANVEHQEQYRNALWSLLTNFQLDTWQAHLLPVADFINILSIDTELGDTEVKIIETDSRQYWYLIRWLFERSFDNQINFNRLLDWEARTIRVLAQRYEKSPQNADVQQAVARMESISRIFALGTLPRAYNYYKEKLIMVFAEVTPDFLLGIRDECARRNLDDMVRIAYSSYVGRALLHTQNIRELMLLIEHTTTLLELLSNIQIDQLDFTILNSGLQHIVMTETGLARIPKPNPESVSKFITLVTTQTKNYQEKERERNLIGLKRFTDQQINQQLADDTRKPASELGFLAWIIGVLTRASDDQ